VEVYAPSGAEIAEAVKICSLFVYLLGEKANHFPLILL